MFRPLSSSRSGSLGTAFLTLIPLVAIGLALPMPSAAQETPAPTENLDHESYLLPPPSVQELLATDKSYATLNYMSPDGDHFLIPSRQSFPLWSS